MCEFIDPEVFEMIPHVGLVIHTLEGDHRASPGDYIIKGVNGEFYPCKPDVFEKTYEPATLTQPNEPFTCKGCVYHEYDIGLCTDCARMQHGVDYYWPKEGKGKHET